VLHLKQVLRQMLSVLHVLPYNYIDVTLVLIHQSIVIICV